MGALSGYSIGTLPIQYLGVNLFKGKANVNLFAGLVEKISNKIEGWQAKLLTTGGKLVLIKSVLNSVPIHQLSILHPPNRVIDILQQKIQSFMWDTPNDKRHQWVKGTKMRCKYSEGGLQVEDLYKVMQALHSRMAWRYITGDSLFSVFLSQKYGAYDDPDIDRPQKYSSHVRNCLKPYIQQLKSDLEFVIHPIGGDKVPIWKRSETGLLRIKEWKESLQSDAEPYPWLTKIWHNSIPARMGVHL